MSWPSMLSLPLSVSVVIPTLNEAERIGRLVTALRTQEYAALQIIVSDGGSEDHTAHVAREAGATVVVSERGVARQRNVGAAAATGELLIFMDADDLPEPSFVGRVAASYRRLPFAAACPWLLARDAGPSGALSYFVFNVLFWLGQSWLRMGSGVCIITPRRVFEAVGGFDPALHLGEDIHYLRRAAPWHGLHRHLLVPLETSGRRFAQQGSWRLMLFYARITPLIMLGCWKRLQRHEYRPIEEDARARHPIEN